MKYAILVGIILLFTACTQDSSEQSILEISTVEEVDEESKSVYRDNEVRLYAEGFDNQNLVIESGGEVVIYIYDKKVFDHYLTINGERVTKRENLRDNEIQRRKIGDLVIFRAEEPSKAVISFDKAGEYKLLDETSGYYLTIKVE